MLDLNESIDLVCAESSEAVEPMDTDHGVDDDGSTSCHN